jgi:hypothetical protein
VRDIERDVSLADDETCSVSCSGGGAVVAQDAWVCSGTSDSKSVVAFGETYRSVVRKCVVKG